MKKNKTDTKIKQGNNFTKIIMAVLLFLVTGILACSFLYFENSEFLKADRYELKNNKNSLETSIVNDLKYANVNEAQVINSLSKANKAISGHVASKNSSGLEEFLMMLLFLVNNKNGRFYTEYNNIYIDSCSLDNYYYVNGSNFQSLSATNYNNLNIECLHETDDSEFKKFIPRNRNAICNEKPELNRLITNDFDTMLLLENQKHTITLKAKNLSSMTDDSWSSGIYLRGTRTLIPNSNKRIGRGAAFYRFHYYDVKGENKISTSNWTAITNIFANGNTYTLTEVQTSCDIEIVLVYETYDGYNYRNFREDFYIKARKDENYGRLILQEPNKSDENIVFPTKTFTTPQGFRILPKPFSKNAYSFNGNQKVNLSFDDCLNTVFKNNGTYVLTFSDVIWESSLTNPTQDVTVIVDSEIPDVKLNEHSLLNYSYFKNDVACLPNGNYTISWEQNGLVPISVTLDGVSIENNKAISPGEHTIVATKNYSTQTVSKTYKVNIGSFVPNHNFTLLKDGSSYTDQINRFSTKFYGVRLSENGVNNTYGYDTQREALDKALEYERTNFVTENSDGTYTYRGASYSDNTSLTAVMNVYAQTYLFENRDLSITENVFLESTLKQDRLYLNGFQFTYNSNPVFSTSVRIIKADDVSDEFSANIKSILRDPTNPNVKNVEYNKTMDEQLTASGKYFILEKNVFGEEYFFEAYFAAANETTASIEYYDTSGIRKTAALSKSNTAMITGTAVNIKTIANAIDPFATIKVRNIVTNASRILVVGDSYSITEAGTYSLTFVDRNNKQFTIVLAVTDPAYILSGVSNGGSTNNDVTISLKNGYVIQSFIVNGVSKGNVFQYNPSTGRYEYTIIQTTTNQEVVLIFTHGGQTVTLAFTLLNT